MLLVYINNINNLIYMLQRLTAKIVLLFLVLHIFSSVLLMSPIPNTYAVDGDGSANLDMTVIPTVEPDSIIGTNFILDVNLANADTSEEAAFNPWFIVLLPPGVTYVSSPGLGLQRTEVLGDGSQLLFLIANGDLILPGLSDTYAINLTSETDANLFTPTDIEVLAYAEDNIYGIGAPPTWSPPATLTGAYDFAGTTIDPTDPDFPNNIDASTDLSLLPFTPVTTEFIPFEIEKEGPEELLIWEIGTTTISITWNDLGPLEDFELIDVIPNNRKFVGFTSLSWATAVVDYDTPGAWQVTLTLSNIDVATGATLDISYETLGLAYEAASYSGTTVLLNTWAIINDQTISTNTVTQQTTGTWNDNTGPVAVDGSTTLPPVDFDASLSFGELLKSVNNPSPVIWDVIRYTITYDVAQNVAYDSGGLWTVVEDILPDGLSFSWVISSTNSGIWDSFSLDSTTISPDGDTTIVWALWAGDTIQAWDFITIVYEVLVDGAYEWAWDNRYENTQSITNTANFYGNVIDSWNNEEWGYTDPSHIGTQDTDIATATVTAPVPSQDKQLVRIEFPDGTIYDSWNPLPSGEGIPIWSRLDFNIMMDLPNVFSTGAKLIDALPLIAGPNTSTYNIAFQTDDTLLDMYGWSVPINDDDADGIADTSINGQTLWGTTPAATSWITPTPANNVEFDIGWWTGAKTFSIGFSVDILPTKPSNGSLAIKNVLIGTFNNDVGTLNTLWIINEPFLLGLPEITLEKVVSPDPTTNIAFWDSVSYTVTLQNIWDAPWFLENIIDVIPANMDLDSFSWVYWWSASAPVPGMSVVQSGATLEIDFDLQTPLNRSFLDIDDGGTTTIDESTIVLTYTLSPTVDFVIVWGESRENNISFDYYSTDDAPSNEVNLIDTPEDTASFTVASPTITRTYFSTSEVDSPMNGGGWRPDIFAWEEAVFETTITLPPGTYTNSRFTEILTAARLNFVSGEVISTWPDLSFSTGTGFTSNIINFWDIVNSGSWPQTIVIQTTARGKNNAARGNNNTAMGRFLSSGETRNINTPVDLVIPTLNVTKNVTPTVADTSGPVLYTINIAHLPASNARAYNVLLKDVLPPNVTYVPGTLTWSTFIGTDTDLFSGSWIVFPSIVNLTTRTLTFEWQLWSWAIAGVTERNDVDIAYSSLDDDGSPVEANYTADNFANLTVDEISVVHYISSTNNPNTGTGEFSGSNPDLTIWEEVTYTIEVDIPELLYTDVSITQTLPDGIEFLTWFVLTDGVTSHTVDTFTINPDGTVTFDFGDIDNLSPGAGSWFVLQTTAVVTNTGSVNAWDIVNSSVVVDYNTSNTASDNTPNFDVVEPGVTITKVYSPDTGDGWDIIPTTITITNPGTASLYDISWSDTLPPKSTSGPWFLTTSSTWVLLPWQSITYTYNTILDSNVVYWEMLTGTASVMWDSMPWVIGEERDYSDTALDIITITGITGVQKDLTSTGTATVWDIESYIIRVPVPEGLTDNITINDLIPAGIQVLSWSINITSSWGISYSWTVTPTIGWVSVWSTQTLDYVFTDIVNSDSNNAVTEYITITYDAVVLNTIDVNDGDTKAEDVTVNYNSGTTILTDGPVPVNIVEPNVWIDLASTYTYGNDVTYTYTITNSGSTTAYDLDIDSILPVGLTYSGAITITNSGWVVGIIQAWEDFTIEELPVNTWSPLQFTIAWIIDGTVADMTDLTVDADLTYTWQDDVYTSVVANWDNTERTGTNTGENDYLDTDPDTITVLLPILNEEISVVDLNGWVGIIWDVFEYTITLTNTGSVDLTDISALLDIPAGFTGFTIITTPSGSTDNSIGTWWTNGAWQVDVSDIDLLIWQSITIVYQVTALDTVPSGTTINSDAVVSDTPEWAIWWNPDVDVTILAPAIQLSKSIIATSFMDPVIPNDTITYQLIAENTWDVALYNVMISDAMLGWDITSTCSFPWTWGTLQPTETATCNPTNYLLTTSDIIRWYVENSAEVDSNDESMNPVGDISDSWVGNEGTETSTGTGAVDGDTTNDPTVQTLTQEPKLTVTKVITATDFNVPNLVWDTITYEITIENTWNLNVSAITVIDPILGWDITSTCVFPTSAAVGLDIDEVATCNPANYVIDVNDIIRGYVDNNATARWTDALGDPVSDVSDPGDESVETTSGDGMTTDGDTTNDPTTIEIIGEPELRVTKIISGSSLSTPTASGDTIDYTITIFNSWQLPVDTITLSDTLLWWDITSSCSFPISASAWLQVWESATCTPNSYIIDETDIVRDYVDNNATANWLDPNDDPVSDVSDPGDESNETPAGDGTTTDGDTTNDPTVQMLTPNPNWEIRKSTLSTPERVWETLEYTFELENTGNITINTPTVTDAKCSTWPNLVAMSDIWSDGRLSPNETWTYTCTSIPVTQSEVDAGEVNNSVVADASTILGTLPTASWSTSTSIAANPGWEIVKSTLSAPQFAGDTLDYTFVLTNTWNVSIGSVSVSDIKCDANGLVRDDSTDINSDNILFQDESWRYACTSIPVTQTEVNNESIVNTVSASWSSASGTLDIVSDTLDTFVWHLPRLQLYKYATFNDENGDGEAEYGETISYNFTVRNTGNVDLSNVVVTDPLITVNGWPIPLLPVWWVDSTSFTGSYSLVFIDINAEYVQNSAIAQAQDLDGWDVFDISDSWDDTIETESWTGVIDSDPANDPTVITYTSRVRTSSGWWGWRSTPTPSTPTSQWPIWVTPSTPTPQWPVSQSPSTSDSGPLQDTTPDPTNTAPDSTTQIPSVPSLEELKNKYESDILQKVKEYEKLQQTDQWENIDINRKWESFLKALPKELPRTGTPINERVSTLDNSRVDTQLPDPSVFRLAGDTNQDISHWTQVLVEEDRSANKYIVIPSNGLVIPVNEFSENSSEFDTMINWREWKINPSLETGALEYPWTSTKGYWEIGNKVVFAHSSYWTDSDGRYKTHFQKIIELDVWEEIWVYEKQEDSSYELYKYVTEKSYDTSAWDTSVLLPWEWKNLTLFTCTPIWGIAGRWIIKWKYIEPEIEPVIQKKPTISQDFKFAVSRFMQRILATKDDTKRLQTLYVMYDRIQEMLVKYEWNQRIVDLLEYIEYNLAKSIMRQ